MGSLKAGEVPLGSSSALSRDRGWDFRHTFAHASSRSVCLCQVYLGRTLREDPAERSECARLAREKRLDLTCHAPGLFKPEEATPSLFAELRDLLAFQSPRRVVVHHDATLPVRAAVDLAARWNAEGFAVLFENYYTDYRPAALAGALASWSAVVAASADRGLALTPLVDFPRLYIEAFQASWPGDLAVALLCAAAARSGLPLAVHAVDAATPAQDRDSWRPFGQGCVPWDRISGFLAAAGASLDHLILEYEDPGLFDSSVAAATAWAEACSRGRS